MADLDDQNQDDDYQDAKKPPSVSGEENPFSGDATSGESPDIDEELKKVGLHGDDGGMKELDIDEELEEEEL